MSIRLEYAYSFSKVEKKASPAPEVSTESIIFSGIFETETICPFSLKKKSAPFLPLVITKSSKSSKSKSSLLFAISSLSNSRLITLSFNSI